MAADRILDGLNAAQREAVTHDAGPLLIVAGAGTGKTTAITRRIAYLIAQRRARPEEILALTFTDKAAAEMEERVDTLVPYGYADVEIATFHAFGDRLLREHALEVGLTPDFRVLTRAEQVIFFRDRLFEFPLARYRPLGDPTRYLQAIISLISRCKDEDIAPEAFRGCADRLLAEAAARPEDEVLRDRAAQQDELAGTYARYQELMARQGAVDFGDQIVHALRLMRTRPHVLGAAQRRFRYILVDEFQDTNYAQFELVKLLAARHRNVVVVADDDQSIYKWRGAAISNVLGFLDHYPGARQIVLSENFRSHQEILDASYRLIVHNNPDRLEVRHGINKHLTAVRETRGRPPAHLHYETATQEADAVAQMIADRVEQGVWSHDDVAILVRSNDDADPFLRSLNLRGVPWTFSGNAGLYGRPEVRLLLAFLRAVAHPDDSVSVHYLASSDIYQVPIVDLTRCATYADRRHRWLFDVLRAAGELPDLSGEIGAEGQAAVAHLVADLVRYMELGREMPTGELLYQFLVDSGWLARMSKATSARDEAEVQNISKFFRRVQDASRALRYDNVREFVKHLDALIEAGEDPAVAEADVETPAVHVLTVHKAKGLEFPVVFLVHLVQEKFPLRRRREQLEVPPELVKDILPTGDFHMQEERRLFYVGMTRARRELYLTSARDYGGARQRKVSQFVLEALDLPRDAARPYRARAVQEIERYAPPAEREGGEAAPAPDEELLLSHKQVDDYETCPLKYRYVHILRVPILRHHTVVYGSTIHRVVETYLRRRVAGNYTSLEDLLAMYDREWENQGFLTWEHQEARKAAGREALTRFWHSEEAEGVKPTHVEKEFGFSLGADRVRGRFDRVDEDLFGATIVDYKTGEVTRQKDADHRAAESLQLKIYALAWREMTGGTLPQRVELRFIESQVVGRHTPTAGDVTAAIDAVKTVAAGIRARRFEATPSYSACRYCPYSQICPYTATRE